MRLFKRKEWFEVRILYKSGNIQRIITDKFDWSERDGGAIYSWGKIHKYSMTPLKLGVDEIEAVFFHKR